MCMYDLFIFSFCYISFLLSNNLSIYYYHSVLIYFVNIFSVNWLAIFNRDSSLL